MASYMAYLHDARSYVGYTEKLAYGGAEHTRLTAAGMGTLGAGPVGKSLGIKGTLKADMGIRHPYLPHTDPIHAFPGSQTPRQVGMNVATTQRQGVESLARAGADTSLRGRLLRNARVARGMTDIGQGSHQLADISAHYAKPQALGIASRAREVAPAIGYGGGLIAGREHAKSGLTRGPEGLAAKLDELEPGRSVIDRAALSRQEGYGRATRRMLEKELQATHGLAPAQAAAAAERVLAAEPGRFSRALGEASRNSRYLRGEARRVGSTLLHGVPSLLRRLVR